MGIFEVPGWNGLEILQFMQTRKIRPHIGHQGHFLGHPVKYEEIYVYPKQPVFSEYESIRAVSKIKYALKRAGIPQFEA